MPKELWLPIFPPGRYKSDSGTVCDLTPDKLRVMARNTDFLLKRGILTPPIAFRHPASARKALGRIDAVKFENNVLSVRVDKPQFIEGARRGDYLDYSGEYREELEFVDDGQSRKIGPVIVGAALLGDELPGIKNAQRKPLRDLVFGEGLSPVDDYEIREELRKTGVVAQTFAEDGAYCFSEMLFDPREFKEENAHMPLDESDLAKLGTLLDNKITAAVKPVTDKVDALASSTDEQFKQFSERARNENEAISWAEGQEKKVPLGLKASELRRNLAIKMANGSATYADFKQFCEEIPARIVSTDRAGGDDKGDEPAAIQKLRPTDFDKPSENDARLAAGMKAFAEEPRYAAQFAIVRDKPYADRLDALKTIVVQRDAATN